MSVFVCLIFNPNHKRTAVWLGPGHVQDFYAGQPNCMVIDSADKDTRDMLVELFSGELIRFYYGTDLICNAVYHILYLGADPKTEMDALFARSLKREF